MLEVVHRGAWSWDRHTQGFNEGRSFALAGVVRRKAIDFRVKRSHKEKTIVLLGKHPTQR